MRPDAGGGRQTATAVFLKIAHPAVARILAGEPALTHLILDAEHGAFSDADLEMLCGLIAAMGKESIVRIAGPDPRAVGRALDRGADGVMIPRVASLRDAEVAICGLTLAPQGARGWDPTVAGFGYGHGTGSRMGAYRCYIQIETAGALDDASPISQLPGVTDLFIGPADLSRALGAEGVIFSPAVECAVEQVARGPRRADVRLGLFVDSAERARWAYGLGYTFFAVSSDVTLLLRGAREVAQEIAALG